MPISELHNELVQHVSEVQGLLLENPEWIDRYGKYANLLLNRRETLQQLARQFNRFAPLQFYMSVLQAKASISTVSIDVRYMGQRVAVLSSKPSGVFLSTSDGPINDKNKQDFGYEEMIPGGTRWKDAVGFRKFFKARPLRASDSKGNEEHNVESLLIGEFEKESSEDKLLLGIQPIKFASKKLRFAMKTPLSASSHGNIKYSGDKGGGIDIFARSGGGGATRLCVIEVKDENVSAEPPQAALEQAVSYAVFIRELLRSKSGPDWWKIFGFRKDLPESIVINAVIAMPLNEKRYVTDFAHERLAIGNDYIECHYLYFTRNDEGELLSIDSSLRSSWKKDD